MTPATIVGLLAEPARLRVFSAIALGASTLSEVASAAGVSVKDAAGAVRRLRSAGLVVDDGAEMRVDAEALRNTAREAEPAPPVEDHGSGDQQVETLLRTFTREGRLTRVPAQLSRRRTVLQYLAERSFEPGARYDEKAINETLRDWCEGSNTDHVTIRRYLIDLCLLERDAGLYWLREPSKA
ncbi:hypothetical protein GCM10010377_73010 [Streptomyces viridiviolaceus]|uniref:DUF2087 domain-containing protein n=1 Tax=Streptomyces viridiviolaceus TaxID=68282 RepID=A0ABW2DZX5_9ACTN|nr:DUF2087 domain-containing protein [Streptomyces viridiviolaceus]GHB71911.1 hypothetical protein GCM10010377_73010 [Streptomyces viridiviolaceus]